jgi:hypothetical protein
MSADPFAPLIARAKERTCRIVFPEATEFRTLAAASRLHREQIVRPILVGEKRFRRAVGGRLHAVATRIARPFSSNLVLPFGRAFWLKACSTPPAAKAMAASCSRTLRPT